MEIKIGDSVASMTDEELKKIRLSFDPDSMGFDNNIPEGGE